MLSLRAERREQLRAEIEANARPSAGFFALLLLATIIASMGLLANSAAVIIGAMLVAPLMSAILGLALATVTQEHHLSERSLVSLGGGVLIVIMTAWIAGSIVGVPTYGPEITGRTHPTLLDLMVAVAAGLAGAYSLVRADGSAVLPGVAIATALVPPLSVVGLELAVRDVPAASAAFLLFLSNFLAIYLAAALLFTLAGFHPLDRKAAAPPYRRYAVSVLSFGVVGVILTVSLRNTLAADWQRVQIRRVMQAQARTIRGAQLADLTVQEGKPLTVQATIRTPASFNPHRVMAMEQVVREKLGQRVHLVVRSIIAKDADASGYLAAPVDLDAPPAEQQTPDSRVGELLAEAALDVPGVVPVEHSVQAEGDGYHVQVRYRARAPLDAAAIWNLQNMLVAELKAPVHLQVDYTPSPPAKSSN